MAGVARFLTLSLTIAVIAQGRVAGAADTPAATEVVTSSVAVPLWGEFREGMTPEEAAEAARKIPGVKDAKIERGRDGEARVRLTYPLTSRPPSVAGKASRIGLEFRGGKLISVTIEPYPMEFGRGCFSDGLNGYKYYYTLLSGKYSSNFSPDDIISPSEYAAYSIPMSGYKAKVGRGLMQSGFTDGSTQIVLSFEVNARPEPPKGGVDLIYSMCVGEGGVAAIPKLTYWSRKTYEADRVRQSIDTQQRLDELSRGL